MALKTKTKKWGAPDKAKIEAAKKKLGDLKQQEKGGGGKDYAKIVDGKNVLRPLPFTWAASGDFYVEVLTHFNIGPNDERSLCPTMHGGKCPLCRQAKKGMAEAQKLPRNDKKRDKMWKEAKDLFPRRQFAFLALPVEPEADDKPKIFQIGPKAFKDILKYYTDAEEYGPITDLQEGRDLVITKTKTGNKPTDVEYAVSLRSPEKSIKVDEEVMEQVTANGPDLDKIYGEEAMPSFEEITAKMEGVEYEEDEEKESEEDSDGDDDEEDEKPKTKKKHPGRFQTEASDDDDEEDEEDEKPKTKKKASSDDDDDEEEESEEEDEEESDSDEEDGEDEDEEKSAKPSFRERLKAKAKK